MYYKFNPGPSSEALRIPDILKMMVKITSGTFMRWKEGECDIQERNGLTGLALRIVVNGMRYDIRTPSRNIDASGKRMGVKGLVRNLLWTKKIRKSRPFYPAKR
jgi:hypothetical protein